MTNKINETLPELVLNGLTAYEQDQDGNERTLQITEPDPRDGTLVLDLGDDKWIRLVLE